MVDKEIIAAGGIGGSLLFIVILLVLQHYMGIWGVILTFIIFIVLGFSMYRKFISPPVKKTEEIAAEGALKNLIEIASSISQKAANLVKKTETEVGKAQEIDRKGGTQKDEASHAVSAAKTLADEFEAIEKEQDRFEAELKKSLGKLKESVEQFGTESSELLASPNDWMEIGDVIRKTKERYAPIRESFEQRKDDVTALDALSSEIEELEAMEREVAVRRKSAADRRILMKRAIALATNLGNIQKQVAAEVSGIEGHALKKDEQWRSESFETIKAEFEKMGLEARRLLGEIEVLETSLDSVAELETEFDRSIEEHKDAQSLAAMIRLRILDKKLEMERIRAKEQQDEAIDRIQELDALSKAQESDIKEMDEELRLRREADKEAVERLRQIKESRSQGTAEKPVVHRVGEIEEDFLKAVEEGADAKVGVAVSMSKLLANQARATQYFSDIEDQLEESVAGLKKEHDNLKIELDTNRSMLQLAGKRRTKLMGEIKSQNERAAELDRMIKEQRAKQTKDVRMIKRLTRQRDNALELAHLAAGQLDTLNLEKGQMERKIKKTSMELEKEEATRKMLLHNLTNAQETAERYRLAEKAANQSANTAWSEVQNLYTDLEKELENAADNDSRLREEVSDAERRVRRAEDAFNQVLGDMTALREEQEAQLRKRLEKLGSNALKAVKEKQGEVEAWKIAAQVTAQAWEKDRASWEKKLSEVEGFRKLAVIAHKHATEVLDQRGNEIVRLKQTLEDSLLRLTDAELASEAEAEMKSKILERAKEKQRELAARAKQEKAEAEDMLRLATESAAQRLSESMDAAERERIAADQRLAESLREAEARRKADLEKMQARLKLQIDMGEGRLREANARTDAIRKEKAALEKRTERRIREMQESHAADLARTREQAKKDIEEADEKLESMFEAYEVQRGKLNALRRSLAVHRQEIVKLRRSQQAWQQMWSELQSKVERGELVDRTDLDKAIAELEEMKRQFPHLVKKYEEAIINLKRVRGERLDAQRLAELRRKDMEIMRKYDIPELQAALHETEARLEGALRNYDTALDTSRFKETLISSALELVDVYKASAQKHRQELADLREKEKEWLEQEQKDNTEMVQNRKELAEARVMLRDMGPDHNNAPDMRRRIEMLTDKERAYQIAVRARKDEAAKWKAELDELERLANESNMMMNLYATSAEQLGRRVTDLKANENDARFLIELATPLRMIKEALSKSTETAAIPLLRQVMGEFTVLQASGEYADSSDEVKEIVSDLIAIANSAMFDRMKKPMGPQELPEEVPAEPDLPPETEPLRDTVPPPAKEEEQKLSEEDLLSVQKEVPDDVAVGILQNVDTERGLMTFEQIYSEGNKKIRREPNTVALRTDGQTLFGISDRCDVIFRNPSKFFVPLKGKYMVPEEFFNISAERGRYYVENIDRSQSGISSEIFVGIDALHNVNILKEELAMNQSGTSKYDEVLDEIERYRLRFGSKMELSHNYDIAIVQQADTKEERTFVFRFYMIQRGDLRPQQGNEEFGDLLFWDKTYVFLHGIAVEPAVPPRSPPPPPAKSPPPTGEGARSESVREDEDISVGCMHLVDSTSAVMEADQSYFEQGVLKSRPVKIIAMDPEKEIITFGRSEDCDVIISGQNTVHRKHFQIKKEGDRYFLYHIGKTGFGTSNPLIVGDENVLTEINQLSRQRSRETDQKKVDAINAELDKKVLRHGAKVEIKDGYRVMLDVLEAKDGAIFSIDSKFQLAFIFDHMRLNDLKGLEHWHKTRVNPIEKKSAKMEGKILGCLEVFGGTEISQDPVTGSESTKNLYITTKHLGGRIALDVDEFRIGCLATDKNLNIVQEVADNHLLLSVPENNYSFVETDPSTHKGKLVNAQEDIGDHHAVIIRQGDSYTLRKGDGKTLRVNNRPVTGDVRLRDKDVIQFFDHPDAILTFRMRSLGPELRQEVRRRIIRFDLKEPDYPPKKHVGAINFPHIVHVSLEENGHFQEVQTRQILMEKQVCSVGKNNGNSIYFVANTYSGDKAFIDRLALRHLKIHYLNGRYYLEVLNNRREYVRIMRPGENGINLKELEAIELTERTAVWFIENERRVFFVFRTITPNHTDFLNWKKIALTTDLTQQAQYETAEGMQNALAPGFFRRLFGRKR